MPAMDKTCARCENEHPICILVDETGYRRIAFSPQGVSGFIREHIKLLYGRDELSSYWIGRILMRKRPVIISRQCTERRNCGSPDGKCILSFIVRERAISCRCTCKVHSLSYHKKDRLCNDSSAVPKLWEIQNLQSISGFPARIATKIWEFGEPFKALSQSPRADTLVQHRPLLIGGKISIFAKGLEIR